MSQNAIPPTTWWQSLLATIKRIYYNHKLREVLIGFIGWYLVNGAIWFVLSPPQPNLGGIRGYNGEGVWMLNIILLPANVIALLVLAVVRRWVALGVLLSYGVNFILAALWGTLIYGECWIPFFTK